LTKCFFFYLTGIETGNRRESVQFQQYQPIFNKYLLSVLYVHLSNITLSLLITWLTSITKQMDQTELINECLIMSHILKKR